MQGFAFLNGAAHPLSLASDGRGGFVWNGVPVTHDGDLLRLGERTYPVITARDGDRLWVYLDGEAHELVWQDAVTHYAEEAGGAAADTTLAPMPGVVVAVTVTKGEAVSSGQTLMIIESMKLETAIKAPRDGVVDTVHLDQGATFERDALLVSLEPLA